MRDDDAKGDLFVSHVHGVQLKQEESRMNPNELFDVSKRNRQRTDKIEFHIPRINLNIEKQTPLLRKSNF